MKIRRRYATADFFMEYLMIFNNRLLAKRIYYVIIIKYVWYYVVFSRIDAIRM